MTGASGGTLPRPPVRVKARRYRGACVAQCRRWYREPRCLGHYVAKTRDVRQGRTRRAGVGGAS